MDLRGKAVTVVGLARSGVGAANLLAGLGASVTVTDKKSVRELSAFTARLNHGIKSVLGAHPPELFEKADLIVVSPGVPLTIAPLRKASESGKKIIGELELAYQVAGTTASRPSFLAITGTNGKSTTTSLLFEMLRRGGFRTAVGGNIGNALTEELFKDRQASGVKRQALADKDNKSLDASRSTLDASLDFIVVEVSSFQLETIDEFRPRGATILNITPDHLDRYPSMDVYVEAKCRIFENQGPGDFLVLNADDAMTPNILALGGRQWAGGNRPGVFYFSRQREVEGAYLKDDVIYFRLPGVPSAFNLQPSTFKIKGVHNIENAMAASAMALLSGCSTDAVEQAVKEFPGLEHRLEFVRELDGVKFINDSKGTNVGAVLKSLESFREPVVLIAGGRDKDSDFTELRSLVHEKVKALILIGEAKDKIRKALGDMGQVFMEDDFRAAVAKARDVASPGDIVLLSPACASFDMFRDFEDRGRQFKKAVMEL